MQSDPIVIYANWAMYAVLGRLAQADSLMRTHGSAVRMVADAMRARFPFPERQLHRGILMDGPECFDASGREFTSWSEDPEVADWFAHPRSAINTYIVDTYPRARGFVMTLDKPPQRVLLHHSWRLLQDLPQLALMHPDGGVEFAHQLAWALLTQKEVITEPLQDWPERRPFTSAQPPQDHRFAPPWHQEASSHG